MGRSRSRSPRGSRRSRCQSWRAACRPITTVIHTCNCRAACRSRSATRKEDRGSKRCGAWRSMLACCAAHPARQPTPVAPPVGSGGATTGQIKQWRRQNPSPRWISCSWKRRRLPASRQQWWSAWRRRWQVGCSFWGRPHRPQPLVRRCCAGLRLGPGWVPGCRGGGGRAHRGQAEGRTSGDGEPGGGALPGRSLVAAPWPAATADPNAGWCGTPGARTWQRQRGGGRRVTGDGAQLSLRGPGAPHLQVTAQLEEEKQALLEGKRAEAAARRKAQEELERILQVRGVDWAGEGLGTGSGRRAAAATVVRPGCRVAAAAGVACGRRFTWGSTHAPAGECAETGGGAAQGLGRRGSSQGRRPRHGPAGGRHHQAAVKRRADRRGGCV
jgi:hypothetical protein